MLPDITLPARTNISDDVAGVLREMIFDGRLPAGGRVNEVHLAQQLGVSRTPLREALRSLVTEGALYNVPRRGVFVRPLTAEEANDIYPIRAYLDPEALRLSGLPGELRLRKLIAINKKLSGAKDAYRAIQLDDAWCYELWANCDNSALIGLIELFMRRTRRYELASMGDMTNVARTAGVRSEIHDHLQRGEMDRACKRLRQNLLDGVKPVLLWLKNRDHNKS